MDRLSADRLLLGLGASLAALGVALGAFGAHGLRHSLGAAELGWWQTAVQYQMWHALALVAISRVAGARTPALLLAAGSALFSGTLYVMALTGARWLAMATPLGGLLLIAGWALLAWRAFRPR